jgi:hypothetical protein
LAINGVALFADGFGRFGFGAKETFLPVRLAEAL